MVAVLVRGLLHREALRLVHRAAEALRAPFELRTLVVGVVAVGVLARPVLRVGRLAAVELEAPARRRRGVGVPAEASAATEWAAAPAEAAAVHRVGVAEVAALGPLVDLGAVRVRVVLVLPAPTKAAAGAERAAAAPKAATASTTPTERTATVKPAVELGLADAPVDVHAEAPRASFILAALVVGVVAVGVLALPVLGVHRLAAVELEAAARAARAAHGAAVAAVEGRRGPHVEVDGALARARRRREAALGLAPAEVREGARDGVDAFFGHGLEAPLIFPALEVRVVAISVLAVPGLAVAAAVRVVELRALLRTPRRVGVGGLVGLHGRPRPQVRLLVTRKPELLRAAGPVRQALLRPRARRDGRHEAVHPISLVRPTGCELLAALAGHDRLPRVRRRPPRRLLGLAHVALDVVPIIADHGLPEDW